MALVGPLGRAINSAIRTQAAITSKETKCSSVLAPLYGVALSLEELTFLEMFSLSKLVLSPSLGAALKLGIAPPTWSAGFFSLAQTPLMGFALCTEQIPGAADFRLLPENRVVLKASPSPSTTRRSLFKTPI